MPPLPLVPKDDVVRLAAPFQEELLRSLTLILTLTLTDLIPIPYCNKFRIWKGALHVSASDAVSASLEDRQGRGGAPECVSLGASHPAAEHTEPS